MSMWVVTMGIGQLANWKRKVTKVIHRIPLMTSHRALVRNTTPIAITNQHINTDQVIVTFLPIIQKDTQYLFTISLWINAYFIRSIEIDIFYMVVFLNITLCFYS